MKRISKVLIMVAALAIVLASLYGCTQNTGNTDASPSPIPSSSPDSAPVSNAPEKDEVVEINVFDAGGAVSGFDQDDPVWEANPVAKKILEDINVKIKFEFPTGDGNEKLGILLAGGDYPEVVLRANDVMTNKMIAEGIAIELDSLIEQYGPNIKSSYGSVLDLLRSDDGKLYSLSRGYGELKQDATPPGFGSGFVIRQDAYEALGSPEIKNLDDIYNILVKLAEQYPENHAGEKVWPLGGYVQTWQNGIQTLLSGAGMENDVWYPNNGNIEYWVRSPQALEVVKFYNKAYREGLLDPEAFTLDRATWTETKVQTARTMSFFGGWWMAWTVHNDYAAAGIENAENMNFMTYPFAVSENQKERPKLTPINKLGSRSVVVTTACPNPDAVVKLLDYFSTPEGNFMVQNGAEGIMWDMQSGKPVMKPEFKERWLAGEADEKFGAETGLRLYHNFVATDVGRSPWDTYWILKDDPEVMGDANAKLRDSNLGPYWYDSYPTGGLFSGAPEEIGMLQTQIEEKFNSQLYISVMAGSEAECEAEFNKYVADLEAIGLADYETYANEVYHSRIR